MYYGSDYNVVLKELNTTILLRLFQNLDAIDFLQISILSSPEKKKSHLPFVSLNPQLCNEWQVGYKQVGRGYDLFIYHRTKCS